MNTLEISKLCNVLRNEKRVEIFNLLKARELCVTDLCGLLQMKQPQVSEECDTLENAQLIVKRKDGRQVMMKANIERMEALSEALAKLAK